MPPRVSPAKASFDALLDSNAQWFEWIDASGKFESLLRDKIPWNQLDDVDRAFVQLRMKSAAPSRQLLINSLYLTMVAAFEEFLRDKIRDSTRAYAKAKQKYEDVEEPVRRTHIRESARLLRRIDSPPDYLALNVDELCRGLGSCLPNSDAVLLNPDAFADVDSLVLLENFASRIAIFGIDCSFDILGRDPNVRSSLKMSRGGAREVSKALSVELGVMRRNRNRIAHTGGNAADVTVDVLSDHRSLLKTITSVIDAAVN
jgi:hypothetical protein